MTSTVIPGRAAGASPDSMTTIPSVKHERRSIDPSVCMDSGLARFARAPE